MKQKKTKMAKNAKKNQSKIKNEKGKKDTRWSQEIVASVTRPQKRVQNAKKGVPLETRNSAFCDKGRKTKVKNESPKILTRHFSPIVGACLRTKKTIILLFLNSDEIKGLFQPKCHFSRDRNGSRGNRHPLEPRNSGF
jgi:hypothetical protein